MVELFNITLATMLSVYVNEHHRDLDDQLPYVKFAYRSAEHETTSCTPNSLMLGRKVATPPEVMYEMPPSVSDIPPH